MLTVALLAGLILGAGGCWFLQRAELVYLRKELAIAQDRLLHAWRDEKAVIPARPSEPTKMLPLPKELQEAVDEWDDPETKAAIASKLREAHFDRGLGILAALKELEAPKY